MNVYLSEEEQIQKIKTWWKEYGKTILTAIIAFLALSYGWRYWSQYKTKQIEQASIIYEQMLAANANHKTTDFTLLAKHLRDDYKRTPYASFASLLIASENIRNQNLSEAEQNLDWVVQHSGSKSLRQIARLREARVLLTDQQAQKALELIQKIDDNTFLPMINNVKGDILVEMHKPSEALAIYKSSYNALDAKDPLAKILELKINQVSIKQ